MKKRLLITLTFPPDTGGMQSFAYQRCLRAGDEPVVLAPWHPGGAEFDAIQPFPVFRWRPFPGNFPGLKRIGQLLQPLLLARQLLQQESFDAVECWQPLPLGLTAWLLKRIYGLPVIIWSHGSDLLRVQRLPGGRAVLRWTLSQADRLIANSMATQVQMERLGQDPARIRVIHPSVNTQRFHPQIDGSAVVARHHLQGKSVILTVARLVERKGIDVVIRAMPKVLEAIPDAVYLVIGTGPYQEKLERLARESGLEGKVIFVGRVPDEELPYYYGACDLFVLLSRTLVDKGEIEGFGIVFLEAGACGKPVIGGKGGGTSEAIEDGVTGLLVDPLDVNEISNAIVRVLEDEELARRLGENGRKRAAKQPDWDLLKLPSPGCDGCPPGAA
ncbi:MAG: glycosyltransferase family 4 protein [Anaerolineales bacterium]|nr:glycosyltransferase family 4 protein [Anaerolineales bacterium]